MALTLFACVQKRLVRGLHCGGLGELHVHRGIADENLQNLAQKAGSSPTMRFR